jgi:hypothetical protein
MRPENMRPENMRPEKISEPPASRVTITVPQIAADSAPAESLAAKPTQRPAQKSERNLKESVKVALLAGFCGLMLLAPEFVLQLVGGRVNLPLLRWELAQKVVLAQSLLLGTPDQAALRNAIIGQESGGNHTLLNASGSGAMGLGQVMPENVALWSREILGREVSAEEFLNDPHLQLTIIDGKLQQYWAIALWQAHGNSDEAVRRVASWWYCGDPHKFANEAPQYWNGDVYPSIAQYTQDVLHRFKAQRFRLL